MISQILASRILKVKFLIKMQKMHVKIWKNMEYEKNRKNVQIERETNRTWCKALMTSNPGIPGDGKVSLKSL